MKKTIKLMALAVIALLALGLLAGCGGGSDAEEEVVTYIAGTEPTYPAV